LCPHLFEVYNSFNFQRSQETNDDKEFTTVSIPTSLYKKSKRPSKARTYLSIKLYREGRPGGFGQNEPAEEVFNKEDEEKVKERLKASDI